MFQKGILKGSNGRMHCGLPIYTHGMQPRAMGNTTAFLAYPLRRRLHIAKPASSDALPHGLNGPCGGLIKRRVVEKLRCSETNNIVQEEAKVCDEGDHHEGRN